MTTTITMPQLGETVTEGTVAQWLKKVGDTVEKYEAFVEVSTDKVNAEVPAPVSGTIRELIVQEGQTVPTGAPIAIIEEVTAERTPAPSEAIAEAIPSSYGAPGGMREPAPGVTPEQAARRAESVAQGSDEPVPGMGHAPAYGNGSAGANGASAATPNGAPAPAIPRGVSPAVRRLAREHHIDIGRVRGTGDNGRVTAEDVIAAAKAGGAPAPAAAPAAQAPSAPVPVPAPSAPAPNAPSPAPAGGTYANPVPGQTIALSQARKIIAQRMVESKHTAPHAWTMVEVDVTSLAAWRNRAKAAFERDEGVKLTFLPFFIRAVVEALAAYPLMNARFTEAGIHVNKDVHVGIAVALEGNLMVPVIRNADRLSIKGIALAADALISKARRGKLGADDLTGGTFTVNNTGANGSIMSAPIINGGQAGIVTMEAIVKRPVVTADDAIAVRSMLNVCLSLDHRVVDGAIASGFLVDLKRRLEALGPGGAL